MDFDGFGKVDITKNDYINIFPTFADNNTIIWTSYMRGKPDLYKGSLIDGSSKIYIYSKAVESSPDVSHIDGTVAYASSKGGNLISIPATPMERMFASLPCTMVLTHHLHGHQTVIRLLSPQIEAGIRRFTSWMLMAQISGG